MMESHLTLLHSLHCFTFPFASTVCTSTTRSHSLHSLHHYLHYYPQEIELLLHGLPNIDMDDWVKNTEYTGEFANSPGTHTCMALILLPVPCVVRWWCICATL
jgi:hypothetical protein